MALPEDAKVSEERPPLDEDESPAESADVEKPAMRTLVEVPVACACEMPNSTIATPLIATEETIAIARRLLRGCER